MTGLLTAIVKMMVTLKQILIDVAQMMSGPITDLINAVVALMYDIENLLEKVLLLLNA